MVLAVPPGNAMRLMFQYIAEQGEDIIGYDWVLKEGGAVTGRYREDFKYTAPVLTPSAIKAMNRFEVYWEPDTWANDHDINGTLTLQLKDGTSKDKTFRIVSRQLEPQAIPMEGTDVAMLEAVLWQLGISPQYGYPGSQGGRIVSAK